MVSGVEAPSAVDVTMPQLGETVSEGTLTRWLKSVGDDVVEGEPLFEVSTDKVDTEVPATASGRLTEILVEVDRTVPVGARLAVIGGAAAPEPRPAGNGDRPAKAWRHSLTPLIRRLLAEHGLDAATLTGTGPNGRITRADVQAAAEAAKSPPAPVVASPAVVAPVPGVRRVPFSSIRRRTAEHMVRSKATSPHTLMVMEVDFSTVDAVRREAGLTYLPFVARAVVDALAAYPHLNASVGDDELLIHPHVHLGIAVDLDADGLVVPVIRDAEDRRLAAIARSITDLAGRARARTLGADDLAGGTFTISNPGPYGTLLTAAIINQPQVAILATDAVRQRPVAVAQPDGSYAIAVHPVGNLALTFDHRAVDGGYAGRFLARLRETLQERNWSAEL